MRTNSDNPERLDSATSDRVAHLGSRDIDTTALEAKIRASLEAVADDVTPRPQAELAAGILPDGDEEWMSRETLPSFKISQWLMRAGSIAAIVAIAAMVIFFPVDSGQQAIASTFDLSTLHHELVDGRLAEAHAQSIDEANAQFAAQRADASKLPGNLANAQVQSCCLTDVQGKLTSVAVLDYEGSEVTLVVAEAPEFAHKMGKVVEIEGREYFGHSFDGVQMMMANNGDRWLCAMGDLTPEQLATLASQIKF